MEKKNQAYTMNLYCMFDEIAKLASPPIIERNDTSASRHFTEAIQQHPNGNDMSLYCVGQIDMETMEVDVVPSEHPYLVPLTPVENNEV
jgi:hypothetical protein